MEKRDGEADDCQRVYGRLRNGDDCQADQIPLRAKHRAAARGQQRDARFFEVLRADSGVCGQRVARQCQGRRRKVVEVSVETHGSSGQGRKKAGRIQVDVDSLHAGKRDVNRAERAKVTWIVERYLIAPGTIMKEPQGRYPTTIGINSESGVVRAGELEIAVGRSGIINNLERPRGADGDSRIMAVVDRDCPGC